MAYITLRQLKEYLGIDTSEDDGLLSACITRAQGTMESPPPMGTGRVFEGASATRYFGRDAIVGRTLLMEHYDLLSVTTLTNGDGEEIPSTAYRLEPRNSTPHWRIVLLSGYVWELQDEDAEISVTGVWGYSATPPDAIVQATLRLASWYYRQKDTGMDADRALASDGVLVLPSRLPKDVQEVIAAYRRRL